MIHVPTAVNIPFCAKVEEEAHPQPQSSLLRLFSNLNPAQRQRVPHDHIRKIRSWARMCKLLITVQSCPYGYVKLEKIPIQCGSQIGNDLESCKHFRHSPGHFTEYESLCHPWALKKAGIHIEHVIRDEMGGRSP
jgi:hypothetical protein